MPARPSHRKNWKTLPPALSLAEAAAGLAAEPEAEAVLLKSGGQSRREAESKSPPSQASPHWTQVVRTGEAAGAAPAGAAQSSGELGPGTGSYNWAGGPPGQTPSAPSLFAARRSLLPAPPSPPPVCLSPAHTERGGRGGETIKLMIHCEQFGLIEDFFDW